MRRPRPSYKRLYEETLALLNSQNELYYCTSSNTNQGDPDCEHEFGEYGDIDSLTSWGGGFVYIKHTCKNCDFEVWQSVGEQCPPESVPKNQESNIFDWRE